MSNFSSLSGRRRQVADLIVKGYTPQEIAALAGMSWKTVHSHRRTIFALLGIRSDLQLFALAVRERIAQSPAEALSFVDEVLPA